MRSYGVDVRRSLRPLLVTLVALVAMSSASAAISRHSVFVSVTDRSGQFVSGLGPQDFLVKEGGQRRAVVEVAPANGSTAIVLLFEEGLIRDTDAKLAVMRLVQRIETRAEIAIVVAGLANTTMVPFTADTAALVVGMNAVSTVPRPLEGHIVEGILDAAHDLGARAADRRILIALTVDKAQIVSTEPDEVLTGLRRTGTMLYAIALRGQNDAPSVGTMIDAAARSRVLSDGSNESGGRMELLQRTSGFPAAMISMADEITHQLKVTYERPDGAKGGVKLEVAPASSALTVRAPRRAQ